MRALVCHEFGQVPSPGVLPQPAEQLAPREVRIAVSIAGLNQNDWLAIAGQHQSRPVPPFIPGGEVAGLVTDVGTAVHNLSIGDRVMAMTAGGLGGMAEVVVTHASSTFSIPEWLPFETAAGFLSSYATAFDALFHAGNASLGQSVLVLGAQGAVGRAAADLASTAGCNVIAVARREIDCNSAEAVKWIAARSDKTFVDDVKTITGSGGIDLVIDPVGGRMFELALSCLRPGGRAVVVGFASGDIPSIRTIQLLLKGISLHGCNLSLSASQNEAWLRHGIENILALFEQGQLCFPAPQIFALDSAREAFQFLRDTRRAKRKVAIDFA